MPTSRKSAPTPYWQSECGRAVVYLGDMREVLRALGRNLFHAVVTDPPYGLEFMGKDWDAPWKSGGVDARQRRADEMDDPGKAKYLRHNVEYVRDPHMYQEWFRDCAEAIHRACKPGAHLLSFGGTRMWHRMACAIEDAGFEVRDCIMWLYGSGFPKGQDIGKAIDRHLGANRTEVIGPGTRPLSQGQFNAREFGAGGYGYKAEYDVRAPATDQAKQWDGWNTALKPAWEPVIVARRPPVGSVAENVLEHGCGGINVDGCRVGTTGADVERVIPSKNSSGSGVYQFNNGEAGTESMRGGFVKTHKDGRYPPNLIHDGSEEAVADMPEGVCRYFYSPKADEDDRFHLADVSGAHPTVKPLDLMRYLVRLVCAKGGTVLDPFMGSGSTGVAALEEGCYFVGVEQSEEYAKIAVDRLKVALGQHPHLVKRLDTGKVVVKDAPPPPRRMR